MTWLPICISVAALVVSAFNLWLTQFRHGALKMTQPTLLCLKREKPLGVPKLFLRTLLHSTGSRGLVVENMLVRIHNSYGSFIFDFWGHTEGGRLTLGSGLFVGPSGIAADHHFNPRQDANGFVFADGEYRVEVLATLLGQRSVKKLGEVTFTVDGNDAAQLTQIFDAQLFLFWNAITRTYKGQIGTGSGMPAPPLWGHLDVSDIGEPQL